VILFDSLLVSGLKFVLAKLADAADSERNEEPVLKEELVALQLRLELGEIGEAEFVERERELLARLRELREAREGPAEGGWQVAGVEAELTGDQHEPASATASATAPAPAPARPSRKRRR
jgi:hypothetical protein